MMVAVEVERSGWTPAYILKEELREFVDGWDIVCVWERKDSGVTPKQ